MTVVLRPGNRRDLSFALASCCLVCAACCVSVVSLAVSLPPVLVVVFAGVMVPVVVGGGFALLATHGLGGMNFSVIWRAARSSYRQLAIGFLAVLIVSLIIGGGVPSDVPGVRDGRYVALQHGRVVDVLSKDEYDDLVAKQLRSVLAVGGVLSMVLAFAWSTPRDLRSGVRATVRP